MQLPVAVLLGAVQPMMLLHACALAALAALASATPLAKGITFSRTVNQHSKSDGPCPPTSPLPTPRRPH